MLVIILPKLDSADLLQEQPGEFAVGVRKVSIAPWQAEIERAQHLPVDV
jgi:hypothetical protein